MIKLKNSEAVGFTNPALTSLFTDNTRTFPMEDAFKISDAMEVIRTRLNPYFTKQKAIIQKNNGSIAADGSITYKTHEDQQNAMTEMLVLGDIELEYPIEKITPSPGWPNLTLSEALILRPILNKNGNVK